MLEIFLTICVACLAVLGGVVLVSGPSWRRARRTDSPGKHYRGDRLSAVGTVVLGAGGAR